MVERFLKQTEFSSYEDFVQNFQLLVPRGFNFAFDVMDVWAKEKPDKQALLWTNDQGARRSYSFSDLKRLTDACAKWMISIGITKGDRVMLMLGRRVEFWITMLSLHKIGAIAIPATHLLTDKDIVYRNNKAEIKAIFCAGEKTIVEHVFSALPYSPSVRVLVSTGPVVPDSFTQYPDLDAFDLSECSKDSELSPKAAELQFPTTYEEGAPGGEDMMLIYFTSGTNGDPKMVAHDYNYALGHLVTGVYWHNLSHDSLHLTIADTGWGKAVWGKMYGQWFAGSCVFVYDHKKFTPAHILQQIQDNKVTSLCAPPTILRFLVLEDMSKYDLSSLRYACTAGEALNPSVFDKFKEITGLSLMEGFGQTETTLTLGTFPWMSPKPGSMGKPNPQYDIDLLTPDGRSASAGERGEIVVKVGDKHPVGLFKGYWRDDELTESVLHDGLYHTGDVAWRDEDGYYWFVGRNDDVIKSSGYRISPFEVESVLMTHPAVVECAVTGVPDPVRGTIVKATIVLAPAWRDQAGDSLVTEIQTYVKSKTAPYKYPRVIEFSQHLPKTISGKVRRSEIRRRDRISQYWRLPSLWSAHDVAWVESLL